MYELIKSADLTQYINKKVAIIIPLFQFTKQYKKQCHTPGCFERMFKNRPRTKEQLLDCMEKAECQIANAHLQTHVGIS